MRQISVKLELAFDSLRCGIVEEGSFRMEREGHGAQGEAPPSLHGDRE
jgi:hypothetical protein